ncbi:MAG: hypothetical protein JNK56_33400, partial [Myxococcales bacterium]|nr:hypothetical protein [Myxococcales bacterium]
LALGDAELAVVGGVNLLLSPAAMVFCAKFGGLSPDGRCKTFSADADGFGRGEGGGVVVLKPLSRARADGDRIWAVVRGAAVNNDGASQGLTAPSPRAQEEVLRLALARAGLQGHQIDYVEAHGTGTLLGDPIEAGALGLVLGEQRPPGRPLLVGSVKTNIGHTEGAAGIAGLIKATLALHHRAVPPSLHRERPSPHIDLAALRLRVPTALEPWPAPLDAPALAGVSAFGWGGTNAHVILEAAPPEPRYHALAADDPASLRAALQRLRAATLRDANTGDTTHDVTTHANTRDTPHDVTTRDTHDFTTRVTTHDPPREPASPTRGAHRFAAVARSAHELRAHIDAALTDAPSPALPDPKDMSPGPHTAVVTGAPAVVFVCSPLGSQWRGMARQLLASEPV